MPREPMNEIDAELRRLLAVAPSPQFEARVRTRLETERMAGGWGIRPWMLAATAAAAVLIALVSGALMLDTPSSRLPESPPLNVAVRQPQPPVEPSSGVPDAGQGRRPVALRPAGSRPSLVASSAAGRSSEPEVLVDDRVKAAVDHLFATAAGRVLGDPPVTRMSDLGQPPAEIVVEPLVVEPVRVPVIDSGAAIFQPIPGRSLE
jgi:hypothetical protein